MDGVSVGIPQIIVIVLYSISLCLAANQHGKPRDGEHNFWVSLIGTGIIIGLLVWGGFFW